MFHNNCVPQPRYSRREAGPRHVPIPLVHVGRQRRHHGCGVRRPHRAWESHHSQAVGRHQAVGPEYISAPLHLGDRGRLQQPRSTREPRRPARGHDVVRDLHRVRLHGAHLLRPSTGHGRCADGVAMGNGWRRAEIWRVATPHRTNPTAPSLLPLFSNLLVVSKDSFGCH